MRDYKVDWSGWWYAESRTKGGRVLELYFDPPVDGRRLPYKEIIPPQGLHRSISIESAEYIQSISKIKYIYQVFMFSVGYALFFSENDVVANVISETFRIINLTFMEDPGHF